ncbi:hypothetical protein [Gemmatimonas sp.]
MSTSPRPKSLAMMFLLGAFLTGGAVGFAAERAVSKPVVLLNDEKAMREELARELKLTEEQKVVVDSAWEWRRARNRDIMAVVRPALDSVRDSARVRMMSVLSESQRESFRALIERNQRIADSTAKARTATK